MSKSPVEKMNDFKEELKENNPVKKVDLNSEKVTTKEEINQRKRSYSDSLTDKSRTHKGAIGRNTDKM